VAPATICSDLLKPAGYGRLEPMLRRLTADLKEAGCANLDQWQALRTEQAVKAGFRDAIDSYVTALAGEQLAVYHLTGNEKLPRAVDHDLQMWGCVACNFCVTVCPNDAFFKLPTPVESEIEGRQQYLVLIELCNECGNCLVFCPERGDPAQIKPRLYLDRDRFGGEEGQGFLIERTNGGWEILARPAWEGEVPMLATLLRQEEGLPIRTSDV
jgi:putative selenate reductase